MDLIRQLTVHLRTGFRKDFSGGLIHHILGEDHAVDPIAQHQLLVEFITSHLCQIITPGIKEHGVDQALGALHRQRLAGTDLAVQFQKAILIASLGLPLRDSRILAEGCKNLGLLSERCV